ncbi:MAG: bacillithiol biosynthesis cysteine-adding enzyme BshC [Bacteroidetes bacterium]|nr:bacillithiol biosynthesis cysteine-adding enzyme BshC [Bacteroidota bacterium]
MQFSHIPFSKTGSFSKIFLDYIDREPKLVTFYKYPPVLDSFRQAIKDISSQKFNRKLLVDVITEQYSKSNCQLPIANCQLLLQENTFTVCTGHQLCLFTGQLYFIYKIISTINLSEQLNKKYPENNFVPVFWMASEDHDFDEVNHINLFGKKVEWKNKKGGVVGKYSNKGLGDLIAELKTVLGDSKTASELVELFQNAYTKHADFSSATRYMVNELFGQYGLVVLDPDDARLKREFAEVIKDDLLNSSAHKLVGKSIADLERVNHKVQVNPRDINIFYLLDNQRERIVKANESFNVQNTEIKFSKAELIKEIELHPERFSPNVVLRPLYQQKILPNLAYVGGPAEVSYWLEYKEMFDHYAINFPVLIPRNFVMIIDASVSEKLTKFGLNSEDVFLPINELTAKYIKSISDEKISLESEKENLTKLYKDISQKASLVDATIASSVDADLQKHLKEIDNLEKKMLRTFKQKNETAVNQIEKIKNKLFPNDVLQERYDNFIPFYLKHGKSFIEMLKADLNPMDFRFTIFAEK